MLLMNIGASEWVIIVLLLIFLVAGSNKLSSLARLLGRATGEYEKARELIQNEKDNSRSADSNISASSSVPRIIGPVGSEREKLETIARFLGIEEAELTEDQLRSLISRKIKKR
ncbi:MAG TPA: twin-arginine translocase TatA/TatE family subunit [Nitrososphaeraceae archaeon]|nr:twin-arginine translocase TatA/TatE family subunit [Nitrososphaeraceae archaeon]